MNYRFFMIEAIGNETQESALNLFLAQHKIIHVDRQFVNLGEQSYWSLCVGYQQNSSLSQSHLVSDKKPRIDYKEVLNEREFSIYAALRELRKSLAASDGVPVFAVFTNEQLAKMVQNNVLTATQLKAIDGVGQSKLTRYGEPFIAALNQYIELPHA